ncbi:transposase [Streptomyces sp. PmtA]|uniref:transposase n=1 Tax=Streptomyces sp. PmtA TaxID=3074275 RepID=UPI003014526F
MSLLHRGVRREPLVELSCFRGEFYSCLTSRSDALFELADAVLCGDGPVKSLAELSLVGEHRRGHGGLYAAVARGRIDTSRLRRALASVPLPRSDDGRLVLAIDITCWLRPDAHTSPERILCHTYGRGKDQHIPVPRLAVLDHLRARARPQFLDRPAGRTSPGARGRHRHRHRPPAA